MISQNGEIDLITDIFPEIENLKRIEFSQEQRTLFNSSGFEQADVIARYQERHLLGEMSWGVWPTWEKDPAMIVKRRLNMVNAQSERVLDPSSYWSKMKLVQNPVLIPVTNIYEHRHITNWKNKIPYYVRTNHQPQGVQYYIPGMYQIHEGPDNNGELKKISTFTMITTAANELMYHIHNGGDNPHRMPLFLPLDMAKQWISNQRTLGDVKEILNYKLPADQLAYHTVFTLTGKKQRPDGKAKDEPFDWPGLPPLGRDTAEVKQPVF